MLTILIVLILLYNINFILDYWKIFSIVIDFIYFVYIFIYFAYCIFVFLYDMKQYSLYIFLIFQEILF